MRYNKIRIQSYLSEVGCVKTTVTYHKRHIIHAHRCKDKKWSHNKYKNRYTQILIREYPHLSQTKCQHKDIKSLLYLNFTQYNKLVVHFTSL